MTALRLGTRRSALATTQSGWVADRLRALGHEVELVEVSTEGDRDRTTPLAQLGGTGVFVSALRAALAEGRVDLAVHSLKDLPTTPDDATAVSPPSPPARTPATRSSPATASPSASCRPAPRSAPGRPPARPARGPRPGPGRHRPARQRRHPGAGRHRGPAGCRRARRAPGCAGSAAPTRSPSCSTRSRCCRPPARAPWRWRSARDDAVTAPSCPPSTTPTPAPASPPSGPCSPSSRRGARPRSVRSPRSSRALDGPELSLRAVVTTPDGTVDLRRSLVGDVADPASHRASPRPPPARGRRRRPHVRHIHPLPTASRSRNGACPVSPSPLAHPTATRIPARVAFVGAGPGDPGLLDRARRRAPRRGRRRRHRPARPRGRRRALVPRPTSRSSTPASARTASRSPTRCAPSSCPGRQGPPRRPRRAPDGRRPGGLQRPGRGGARPASRPGWPSRSCPGVSSVTAVPAYAGVPLTSSASTGLHVVVAGARHADSTGASTPAVTVVVLGQPDRRRRGRSTPCSPPAAPPTRRSP